jgi:Family of unknown function (DUF5675)
MELLIDRDVRSRNSTIGVLYVDGKFECFTLEDVDRGLVDAMPIEVITAKKVFGQTAIPEGRYEVVMTYSPKFSRNMPLLIGVKGFDAVRIHWGNTQEDTEGCPLVGQTRGIDFIGNSRNAASILLPKIEAAIAKKEKVFITIKS